MQPEVEIDGQFEAIPTTLPPPTTKMMKSLFPKWQHNNGQPVENNEVDFYEDEKTYQ